MYDCLQMDSPNEVLDWVIITIQCKVDRMNVLLDQVWQPVGSLNLEDAKKLKLDVVGKMNHLVHDSQQSQCWLNKFKGGARAKGCPELDNLNYAG
jgi:hypothetical protein